MKLEVEFFNASDGRVAIQDNGSVYYLDQSHTEMIELILEEAKSGEGTYERLQEIFQNSKMNMNFYRYRMARRFCRCNCGNLDTLNKDIDNDGHWHYEEVACPLRGTGDCPEEGVICLPKKKTELSEREISVVTLLKDHTPEEVASTLNIALRTVYNHIQSAKKKMNVTTIAQLVAIIGNVI